MSHRESLGQDFTFYRSHRHVKRGYPASYTTVWHHNVVPVIITIYCLLSADTKAIKVIDSGRTGMYILARYFS